MVITINSLFFIIFSSLLLLSGLFAIACKNIIYTILWSMVTFLMIGGLFVLLNAAYNAAAQFLIYVVLIPILLAVAIMFLSNDKPKCQVCSKKTLGGILGIILFTMIIGEYLSLNDDIFEIVKACLVYQNTYSGLESIAGNILGVYPVLLLEFAVCVFVVLFGVRHYEK